MCRRLERGVTTNVISDAGFSEDSSSALEVVLTTRLGVGLEVWAGQLSILVNPSEATKSAIASMSSAAERKSGDKNKILVSLYKLQEAFDASIEAGDAFDHHMD